MNTAITSTMALVLAGIHVQTSAAPTFDAAPKGDATSVASRIIKDNFPTCKRVSTAVRKPDGTIRATCDGTSYLVATMINSKEGKILAFALNCDAAKKLLNVSC